MVLVFCLKSSRHCNCSLAFIRCMYRYTVMPIFDRLTCVLGASHPGYMRAAFFRSFKAGTKSISSRMGKVPHWTLQTPPHARGLCVIAGVRGRKQKLADWLERLENVERLSGSYCVYKGGIISTVLFSRRSFSRRLTLSRARRGLSSTRTCPDCESPSGEREWSRATGAKKFRPLDG